ncbi:hypothetical protein [Streptomyces sp. WMMC1477]|uniref:hypothetical protein n=1 Tax=Streptomyces sp. WMMC1477 TaxID=3015155 RepID=UPI0022B73136|nr:hypothetical protein [Streptomyces sp. WMMC1477]MCZ7430442.1 hypothetical protein [Streptomyces sp. WMMC1477]
MPDTALDTAPAPETVPAPDTDHAPGTVPGRPDTADGTGTGTETGPSEADRARPAGSPDEPPRLRDRALRPFVRAVRLARRVLARRPRPPRWWPLAVCALLGLLGGGAWGTLSAPQYEASGYVVVVPGQGVDPASARGYAQAYGRVAGGGAVLATAQKEAGIPVRTLRDSVRAATSPDAPMIEVTGTATSARAAADRANAVVRALTAEGNASAKRTGVELVRFADALPPGGPTSPSAPLSAGVGLAGGALVGALILLVRPRDAQHPAANDAPHPGEPVRRDRGTVR